MKKRALAVVGLVIAIVLFRAVTLPSRQLTQIPPEQVVVGDESVQKLVEAIQVKTISPERTEEFDAAEFVSFQNFLRARFPTVFANLSHENVGNYSSLFTWKGSDEKATPYLFMAHLDVVPVETGGESKWKYPPFSGKVADGFIWGRGSIDDKANVIGMLEAVEFLLSRGFKPKRTVYFAFGHDEELSGEQGAKQIATLLESRGVKLEFVLDEGLFILKGSMPGVTAPIAYIGTAEKGYADLELTVNGTGGHSSMPPRETAVGVLSQALLNIENNRAPAKIAGAVSEMFNYASPEMGFLLRIPFANRWLFEPLLKWQLGMAATTNAMVRTTLAPTMLKGSEKSNVLPANPTAVVNARILPGDSIEAVVEHVRQAVSDERVSVSVRPGANEAVPPSSVETGDFVTIHRTIKGLFPEVLVAPSLMIGGTDSKHYRAVAKNIYRFSPLIMTDEELDGFHGVNERIGVDNFKQLIVFYYNLLRNLDKA